ncbi:MAG TPA: hypothetical protein VED41_13115 [Solirubrobacteraceae bacterium]|nr:hypothetical protein [Solirubrobacteraceae bacterium]
MLLVSSIVDWRAWHNEYTDHDSPLSRRLAVVQQEIRGALARAPSGQVTVLSLCAGQADDLIGVLAGHPRASDVSARLVELDPQNAAVARQAAGHAGLDGVEVLTADASLSDSYRGAVPADLVLLCGVFGNISAEDIARTVACLPMLCASGASVIWTRHRHPPDLTPFIRKTFLEHGFTETAFRVSEPFGVGVNRLVSEPQPFESGVRLFEFVGFDVLAPAFAAWQGEHTNTGGALGGVTGE